MSALGSLSCSLLSINNNYCAVLSNSTDDHAFTICIQRSEVLFTTLQYFEAWMSVPYYLSWVNSTHFGKECYCSNCITLLLKCVMNSWYAILCVYLIQFIYWILHSHFIILLFIFTGSTNIWLKLFSVNIFMCYIFVLQSDHSVYLHFLLLLSSLITWTMWFQQ